MARRCGRHERDSGETPMKNGELIDQLVKLPLGVDVGFVFDFATQSAEVAGVVMSEGCVVLYDKNSEPADIERPWGNPVASSLEPK